MSRVYSDILEGEEILGGSPQQLQYSDVGEGEEILAPTATAVAEPPPAQAPDPSPGETQATEAVQSFWEKGGTPPRRPEDARTATISPKPTPGAAEPQVPSTEPAEPQRFLTAPLTPGQVAATPAASLPPITEPESRDFEKITGVRIRTDYPDWADDTIIRSGIDKQRREFQKNIMEQDQTGRFLTPEGKKLLVESHRFALGNKVLDHGSLQRVYGIKIDPKVYGKIRRAVNQTVTAADTAQALNLHGVVADLSEPEWNAALLMLVNRKKREDARAPGSPRTFGQKLLAQLGRGKRDISRALADVAALTVGEFEGTEKYGDMVARWNELDGILEGLDPIETLGLAGEGLLGAARLTPSLALSSGAGVAGLAGKIANVGITVGTSLRAAGAIGTTAFWYTRTMPRNYAEMRQQGVSHGTALFMSSINSIPESMVETVKFRKLGAGLGKTFRALKQNVTKNLRTFFKDLAKTGIKTYSQQVGEEGIQAAMSIASRAGALHMEGKGENINWFQEFRQIGREMWQATLAMPWLLAPGFGAGAFRGGIEAHKTGKARSEMARDLRAIRQLKQKHMARLAEGRDLTEADIAETVEEFLPTKKPGYKYEAVDIAGKDIKGKVVADSTEEAIKKIREKGEFPTKVEATAPQAEKVTPPVEAAPKEGEVEDGKSALQDVASFGGILGTDQTASRVRQLGDGLETALDETQPLQTRKQALGEVYSEIQDALTDEALWDKVEDLPDTEKGFLVQLSNLSDSISQTPVAQNEALKEELSKTTKVAPRPSPQIPPKPKAKPTEVKPAPPKPPTQAKPTEAPAKKVTTVKNLTPEELASVGVPESGRIHDELKKFSQGIDLDAKNRVQKQGAPLSVVWNEELRKDTWEQGEVRQFGQWLFRKGSDEVDRSVITHVWRAPTAKGAEGKAGEAFGKITLEQAETRRRSFARRLSRLKREPKSVENVFSPEVYAAKAEYTAHVVRLGGRGDLKLAQQDLDYAKGLVEEQGTKVEPFEIENIRRAEAAIKLAQTTPKTAKEKPSAIQKRKAAPVPVPKEAPRRKAISKAPTEVKAEEEGLEVVRLDIAPTGLSGLELVRFEGQQLTTKPNTVFHGTIPLGNTIDKIMQGGEIVPNVSTLDALRENVVSTTKFMEFGEQAGNIVFEIDASNLDLLEAPPGAIKGKDILPGTELRSDSPIPLANIKKVWLSLGKNETLDTEVTISVDSKGNSIKESFRSIADKIKKPGLEVGIIRSSKEIPDAAQRREQETVEGKKLTPPPPQGETLTGGPRAGATTILPDIGAEILTGGKHVGKTAKTVAQGITRSLKRNLKRGINHIATMGDAGKQLKTDMDDIAFRVQKRANNDLQDSRVILKGVSHANRISIAKAINMRKGATQGKKWIADRADALRGILDRSMNEGAALGMQRRVRGKKIPLAGGGKAFPQILNDKGESLMSRLDQRGLADAEVLEVAQGIVAKGQANTVEDAVAQLQVWRAKQLRSANPYLERTRIEMPEDYLEWDPRRVFPHLFERNWLTVEGIRQWQVPGEGDSTFPQARVAIEKIRATHGAKEAQRVEDFIQSSFGRGRASSEAEQLTGTLRSYQFMTKVGLSPLTILRNMFDRLPKGLSIGTTSTNIKALLRYPPFLNRWIRGAQRIEDWALRSGAVFGHSAIAEGAESGKVISSYAGRPFSSSERGNQVFASLVARMQLEKDIARLQEIVGRDKPLGRLQQFFDVIRGKSEAAVRYRLRDLGTQEIVDKLVASKEISPELLDAAIHKSTRDHTFPVLLSTKRIWWDNHPWMRVIAQFKTWPIEQTAHIYRDVLKYTVKTKDPTRLIRWFIGTAIVGELYNIARDFLFDKDESLLATLSDKERRNLWDTARAIGNDLFDGGAIGMFADFAYGLTDWVLGVSYNTGKNVLDAAQDIRKKPGRTIHALRRLAEKEVSPLRQSGAITDRIDRNIANKDNVTAGHWKWRRRSWEWHNDKKYPTLTDKVGKLADDILWGKIKYGRGENTLSYEMAARQITVGDIGDAADHLAAILRDAKTPQEEKKALAGVRQSMQNRSPLGKVAKIDLGKFFQQFSRKEQAEAQALQLKWIRGYNKALGMALKKTRSQRGGRGSAK